MSVGRSINDVFNVLEEELRALARTTEIMTASCLSKKKGVAWADTSACGYFFDLVNVSEIEEDVVLTTSFKQGGRRLFNVRTFLTR